MKKTLAWIVICASVMIVFSFYMPWARVTVSAVGVVRKLTVVAEEKYKSSLLAGKIIKKMKKATDELDTAGDVSIRSMVRGYMIPALANDEGSKVALAAVQVMFKSEDENLPQKSYLVYLFPILGIACGILAFLGMRSWIPVVIMTLISGIVGIGMLYNVSATNLVQGEVELSLMLGLWIIIYAFLLIFVTGVFWLANVKKS